jgi:hypothetical protein
MHLLSFFYFLPRQPFIWNNPNYAAAVFVCFIPLFWSFELMLAGKRRAKFIRCLFVLAELFATVSLLLTKSRGGALGWIVAISFFAICCSKNRNKAEAFSKRSFILPRIVFVGILSIATGLAFRFASVVEGDGSAANRLKLWKGGCELIAAKPFVGWGKGASGSAFMNWVQDPNAKEGYGGMVNSYVHLAVEFGIPASAAYFALLLFPVFLVYRENSGVAAGINILFTASAAGLAGFAVTSLFSTLWNTVFVTFAPLSLLVIALWAFPGGALDILMRLSEVVIASFILLIPSVYGIAFFISSYGDWELTACGDGSLLFSARKAGHGNLALVFLPDPRTLGSYYGKTLRRAIAACGSEVTSFRIYPIGASPLESYEETIVTGPRILELSRSSGVGREILVCPAGRLSDHTPRRVDCVFFPEYDQLGSTGQWSLWARIEKASIEIVPGCGQDISSNWDSVFGRILKMIKARETVR